MSNPRDLTWPAQTITPPLTKVVTKVSIACQPERAFTYATNASLWHTWHPATAKVRDVPARPLVMGETMLESISAAGQKFDAVWTVLACEAPNLWVIATRTERGCARIAYELTATQEGCIFQRTLEYKSFVLPWRWLDTSFNYWLLKRQSRRALDQLKQVLEAQH